MAKNVIMPALGMAQETGTLLRWLKAPGEPIVKGELLMEIETDKAMVEIEAPASGVLAGVTAQAGDVIPVGHVIAQILEANEQAPAAAEKRAAPAAAPVKETPAPRASPVAARIAAERGIDLKQIKSDSGVIQKDDVLGFIAGQQTPQNDAKVLASPKARRLASEQGIALNGIRGSGPDGAVLAADVLAAEAASAKSGENEPTPRAVAGEPAAETVAMSRVWRVMVERLSQAWTTIPHFYLTRDVNATRLITWRDAAKPGIERLTYTDLLVKLVAVALVKHPRVNAGWRDNRIALNRSIHVGLAVATKDGLVVPVIHNANELGLKDIAARRRELVEKAHGGKLGLNDIQDGTFTISNLGMYGVDAFNAIINPPQAGILAVSRIAERVVPVNHQPAVQPMLTLTLSCDHRVIDGARGAQFLDTLAQFIEEPLTLFD